MTAASDAMAAHERAFLEGSIAALDRRAAALRKRAAELTYTRDDQRGGTVTVVPAEAVVKLRTAADFQEAADDLATLLPADPKTSAIAALPAAGPT